MSQSLSKLYVHAIFHIKSTCVVIRRQERASLYAYMTSILNDLGCVPIQINGVEDHVHLLCVMSKNISPAKMIADVKRHSSRWIKGLDFYYHSFEWQGGYAVFSVSPSLVDTVRQYIANQEQHHKRTTFREEYTLILKQYGISYDDEYVWTD